MVDGDAIEVSKMVESHGHGNGNGSALKIFVSFPEPEPFSQVDPWRRTCRSSCFDPILDNGFMFY